MDSSDPTVDCCNISSRRSRSNQYTGECHVDHKSATPSPSGHCKLESFSLRIYRLLDISSRRNRSNQYIDGCHVVHKSATASSSLLTTSYGADNALIAKLFCHIYGIVFKLFATGKKTAVISNLSNTDTRLIETSSIRDFFRKMNQL